MSDLNMSTAAAAANIAELQARARGLGFVLASRCRFCGSPLVNEKSVTAHAGPVCRSRHKESDAGSHTDAA
ncbi:DUF6011 domain-containing protein [Brevibacterium aurantiacum]|uniref:DUF6011 domain-containing protein n=1 Tax=Brevibacterium aurantiacum TaxID=273384 RepID=UPI0018680312|nr:DUF6011 domain-containing protein [Brevibacterium aurantiacum]